MTFRVTVLGSSSAMPTLKRNPSAHALNVHEQFFLIDCGEGTQTRLFRCGISPLRLGTVFLTHLHGDHVYGLFGLMSTLGLLGRRTPLKIFAPRPFDRILASHLSFFDSKLPYEVQWEEIDTRAHRLLYENKTLEVWSIPLRHRVPAAGFLFREKDPAPEHPQRKPSGSTVWESPNAGPPSGARTYYWTTGQSSRTPN